MKTAVLDWLACAFFLAVVIGAFHVLDRLFWPPEPPLLVTLAQAQDLPGICLPQPRLLGPKPPVAQQPETKA